VLSEYVKKKALSTGEAINVVADIFFNTSNQLYDLKLPFTPLKTSPYPYVVTAKDPDLDLLTAFLIKHPETKFLRLQYLDYTATPRLRVVPVKRALKILQSQAHLTIGITTVSLGLLQNDTIIPAVTASGEYLLEGIISSIRPGPSDQFASLQGEFRLRNGSDVSLCPRSVLRRSIEEAKSHGLEFLVGFEIEIVFLSYDAGNADNKAGYIANETSNGQAWNSSRVLQGNTKLLIEIYDTLSNVGIDLDQWHPESSSGQFEFVLPPFPPLEAVDTLLHTREIIQTVVAAHGMRATLHPKPFPMQAGTGSHVHLSIASPIGKEKAIYEAFYAGVLGHLRAIIAFTYSNPASYDRVADGCWAGGRWVTWGTQNRETPLRKIDGSHWEMKCIDGLANVYLAIAAIITAGRLGVSGQEELTWLDCQEDPASLSEQDRRRYGITEGLPATLVEAIEALKEDEMLCAALGRDVVERYVNVKTAEMELLKGMDAHDRQQWIIERY
jgi:glutamine synthetase